MIGHKATKGTNPNSNRAGTFVPLWCNSVVLEPAYLRHYSTFVPHSLQNFEPVAAVLRISRKAQFARRFHFGATLVTEFCACEICDAAFWHT